MNRKPVVAIVGRPNVGKSTFVNRLVGARNSIVDDAPGVTRDRIYFDVDWQGKIFTVIDTGGIIPGDDDDIMNSIFSQAQLACEEADKIIFIVDGKDGLNPIDYDIANVLRKSGKKVFLAVNKIDSINAIDNISEFWALSMGEPIAISASHGSGGIGDLLDLVTEDIKLSQELSDDKGIKIAIVGRPNVGKSSLINRLTKRKSTKVGDRPGVTKGKQWLTLDNGMMLLDTPGILWPKFEDQSVGLKLALTGAIRDEVTNTEELALSLIRILDDRYPGMLSDCYFLKTADVTEDLKESLSMGIEPSQEVITLYKVAKVKGALKPGGVLDTDKAAAMMLENFRNGKIGRFSLEDTDQI